jgi:hypothetical protein
MTATVTDQQSPWIHDNKFAVWAGALIVLFVIERNSLMFLVELDYIALVIRPTSRPN